MKKVILMLLLMPIALAQEIMGPVELNEFQNAGTTPDSPFYGLDRAMETIRLFFTKDIDKAKLRLEFANERLSEIKVMIAKNRNDLAEKAEELRKKQIDEIEKINDIPEEIKQDVNEHLQKHISVLNSVLEKAPEQAKEGLRNAIEESSKAMMRFDNASRSSVLADANTMMRRAGY